MIIVGTFRLFLFWEVFGSCFPPFQFGNSYKPISLIYSLAVLSLLMSLLKVFLIFYCVFHFYYLHLFFIVLSLCWKYLSDYVCFPSFPLQHLTMMLITLFSTPCVVFSTSMSFLNLVCRFLFSLTVTHCHLLSLFFFFFWNSGWLVTL